MLLYEAFAMMCMRDDNDNLFFVQRRGYYSVSTKLTEQQKFAAVDKAVPTTLPLSSIPSKNVLIMKALRPIIDSRQTPRETSEIDGQNHDEMSFLTRWTTTLAFAVQILCTAVITGESGANASLAMKEAVAPRAPLSMARLLMDMEEVNEDDFPEPVRLRLRCIMQKLMEQSQNSKSVEKNINLYTKFAERI